MSDIIRIESADGAFDAHLELPAAPNGHGLVLLQEIFGITDRIRAYCRLFAGHGYVVVAPDLFWRMEPRVELPYTREGTLRAFELLKRFDDDKAAMDIEACATRLRAHPVATVGVVGFCLGGRLAARMAGGDELDVAVAFYGVGIEKYVQAIAGSTCPLQLHYGRNDRFVPETTRAAIAQALAGRPGTESHVYDADHAFFRAELDDEASRSSFERTLRFLRSAGPTHAHAR